MSAFYNHGIQGGAIHALPFVFCSKWLIITMFITGMDAGIMPDILKVSGIETNHEGKINDICKFIPAWFFHTKVIDKYLS